MYVRCLMKNTKQIKRIDIDHINLSNLLLHLKEYGYPYIITKDGKGVAAILPFIDLDEVTKTKYLL